MTNYIFAHFRKYLKSEKCKKCPHSGDHLELHERVGEALQPDGPLHAKGQPNFFRFDMVHSAFVSLRHLTESVNTSFVIFCEYFHEKDTLDVVIKYERLKSLR